MLAVPKAVLDVRFQLVINFTKVCIRRVQLVKRLLITVWFMVTCIAVPPTPLFFKLKKAKRSQPSPVSKSMVLAT